MKRALLLVLLLQDPADVQSGTYVFKLSGQEVGTEEVTFTKTGWTAKGKFDIFGTQKGEYEVTLDGGAMTIVSKIGKKDLRVEAKLKDGKFTVGDKSIEAKNDPVLWENLIWATFYDIGRRLVASDVKSLPAIHVAAVAPFEIKVVERWAGPRRTLGFKLELSGIEIAMLCSPKGLPLRIAVPSQQVDVVLKGFEWAELPALKPVSVLDRGEWRKKLSAPSHEIVSEKKVMIPLRDSVKLAADVYRPKTDGKFPAILIRTPYGRAFEGFQKGNTFAPRGYAVVAQDVRGRFDSEGQWFPFRNETDDGSDTIDWIAKQPWCDGSVGMIGASYVGVVQWYAAKSGNPHLKAICPQVSPPDPDQNIPYEGGCFILGTAWWAKGLEGMMEGGWPNLDWNKVLATLPLGDLDTALGVKHGFLDEWLAHPPTDAAYWEPFRYQTHWAKMNVAVLNISGWFDGDQPGAPMNFVGMRKAGKKDQYLVMGPWGHAFNVNRKLGEVDFGTEAVVDLDSVELRFFDRYLKGVENGMDAEDPVAVFVMGENKWRRAKDWPLPDSKPAKLHLAGEKANKRDGGGRLALEADDGKDTYRYDPAKPPPTTADFNDFVGASATADGSKLEDVDEILDYTSRPLAAPVDVVGPFRASISVSTDAEDTDVFVEIFVLKASGRLNGIIAGIQRVRYRNGRDEPVKPGDIARVEVDCWASGVRLEKGDRIRVQISSSAFPGYARNLGTLEPLPTAKKIVVATNTIHHDKTNASWVEIPALGDLKFE